MKHPFIDHKEGSINVLKNGYRADTRIFLGATLLIVVLATYGWSLQNFTVQQNVYIHCPDDAIGGKCLNQLYHTCDKEYCQSEYFFAGYTYGTPPSMSLQEKLVIVGMIIIFCGALVINHLVYNKEFEFEDGTDENNN